MSNNMLCWNNALRLVKLSCDLEHPIRVLYFSIATLKFFHYISSRDSTQYCLCFTQSFTYISPQKLVPITGALEQRDWLNNQTCLECCLSNVALFLGVCHKHTTTLPFGPIQLSSPIRTKVKFRPKFRIPSHFFFFSCWKWNWKVVFVVCTKLLLLLLSNLSKDSSNVHILRKTTQKYLNLQKKNVVGVIVFQVLVMSLR